MKTEPSTAHQVAEQLGTRYDTVSKAMGRMVAEGVLLFSRERSGKCGYVRRYSVNGQPYRPILDVPSNPVMYSEWKPGKLVL